MSLAERFCQHSGPTGRSCVGKLTWRKISDRLLAHPSTLSECISHMQVRMLHEWRTLSSRVWDKDIDHFKFGTVPVPDGVNGSPY